ncbi:MAG TPA: HAD family hydrolase [Streptosporangiaceae bacterium]
MTDTIIFDVDGTLVDSNYQNALAWYRAFRWYHITVPVWQIHRAIGMGGDQLVSHVAGQETEDQHGDALRAAWREEFDPVLPEIAAFADAVPLLTAVKDRGLTLVLASSGAPDHVEAYLDLIDGHRLADEWTTAKDVQATKPAPDLVQAALDKGHAAEAVMIGDSTWDAKAARKLGVPTYTVRTGGFSAEELSAAGAAAVYDSLAALQADLDRITAPG